jgi:peptide subunit release factor 1 (eRF1)
MLTRDDLRDLAAFQSDESKRECAVSFYFQPETPQDRSHRREAIVAKDVIKRALKSTAAIGKNGWLHADLDRILDVITHVRGNSRAKAVFACAAQKFWKEFDLPAHLGSTNIYLQSRFQLKPLAALLGAQPALCVAIVDRQRARFFDLRLEELSEGPALVHMLSRNSSSYGFKGYEGGHAERRISEEALQHYKAVSERLLSDLEKGTWQRLIVGVSESNCAELSSQLHPYVKQRIIGRFSADVASVSDEEIRDHASSVLQQWIVERGSAKAEEALDFAKANGRGVAGLRRVLQALEAGEVQSLFLAENYSAHAVECPNCGHLDSRIVTSCAACGHNTRELTDVCDAMIPIAIRRDIELFCLKNNPQLDRAGNVAALLRFRSDQNRAVPVAS